MPIKLKVGTEEKEFESPEAAIAAFQAENERLLADSSALTETKRRLEDYSDLAMLIDTDSEAAAYVLDRWEKTDGGRKPYPKAAPAATSAQAQPAATGLDLSFIDSFEGASPEAKSQMKAFLSGVATRADKAEAALAVLPQAVERIAYKAEMQEAAKEYDKILSAVRSDPKFAALKDNDEAWGYIDRNVTSSDVKLGVVADELARQASQVMKFMGGTSSAGANSGKAAETLPSGIPFPSGASATTGVAPGSNGPKNSEEFRARMAEAVKNEFNFRAQQ